MNPATRALTWTDLYRDAAEVLGDRREARWIVEEASGEPYGRTEGPVPPKAALRVQEMVRRRSGGEPLQYVLGSWPFRRLELHGMIREPGGAKMSKSSGRAIDPTGIIRDHGADALRLALCRAHSPGKDLALDQSMIAGARAHGIKLDNICRALAAARGRAAGPGPHDPAPSPEAARLLEEEAVFIAIAAPIRWSLVDDRLAGFAENIVARHPLVGIGKKPNPEGN